MLVRIKVGQLQKGKIFTVYSGETFDLKWYSGTIEFYEWSP